MAALKIEKLITANNIGSVIGARFALGFAAMLDMAVAPAMAA